MKISYRPEIDGLRAIAILSVIIYHAKIHVSNSQVCQGGFVGVDVFFVISGYLIFSLIFKELNQTNYFSFKHFYERRARRILPALLFMIICLMPMSWIIMTPHNMINFAKSIGYSLSFLSNFYFYNSGLEYNSQEVLLTPLLHTWSLAVEEQFYILFPALVYILYKICKKHLEAFLLAGIIISLSLAYWSSRYHPTAAFYLIHSRFWELLSGSILAYYEIKIGYRPCIPILQKVMPIAGVIMILSSIFYFNDQILHPSLITLIPVIGTCILIWQSNQTSYVVKIISSKLFVFIGLISYSLYLWHFPVFAFGRISLIEPSLSNKMIGICLILILSLISYAFIEKPLRNAKIISTRIFLILVNLSLIILVIFMISVTISNGFISRLSKSPYKFAKIQNLRTQQQSGNVCFDRKQDLCTFNKNSNKSATIIGDSTLAAISPNLTEKLVDSGYKVTLATSANFIWLPEAILIDSRTNIADQGYNLLKKTLEQIINTNEKQIIIIGGSLSSYLYSHRFYNSDTNSFALYQEIEQYVSPKTMKHDTEYLEKQLIETINKLLEKHLVIFIFPIPESSKNTKQAILNNIERWSYPKMLKKYSQDINVYLNEHHQLFNLINQINANNLYKVYPHKVFCNQELENRCVYFNEHHLFYDDDLHLSWFGAELLSNQIMKVIANTSLNSD